MKVICIDDKLRAGEYPDYRVKEGETYTVVDQRNGVDKFGNRIPCYELQEFPKKNMFDANLFQTDRFIPTSNIDETEFERNYNLQLCASPSSY